MKKLLLSFLMIQIYARQQANANHIYSTIPKYYVNGELFYLDGFDSSGTVSH